MKRIAIFCDGTWNNRDKTEHDTNVARLREAVSPVDPHGTPQIATYFAGVGRGAGNRKVSQLIDKFGGAAFGWGLNRDLKLAFRYIAKHYEPGDEIMLFGFSRGAYTARTLGGLIRAVGIPAKDQKHRINAAIDRYRNRSDATHPASESSFRFRLGFAPGVNTGEKELQWRLRHGHAQGKRVYINYLGVWDTVGSLGVPNLLGAVAKIVNRKYQFHDTKLSRSTRAGRHAVAIDDPVLVYKPTLWTNLSLLNQGHEKGPADQPYQQRWFPGEHGTIGGSRAERQLSDLTLHWIAQGAVEAGLALDFNKLPPVPDPASQPHRASFGAGGGGVLAAIPFHREGPDRIAWLSEPAIDRLRDGDHTNAPYDPAPLRLLRKALAPVIGRPYRAPRYPQPNPPKPNPPIP